MFSRKKIRSSTKNLYDDMPNGYLETIEQGIRVAGALSRHMSLGKGTEEERILRLREELQQADALVIGAGAGLSTSAGFSYSGDRFDQWFGDFADKYGFQDMYAGGFYPYSSKEEFWAYWARYIYVNRYLDPPRPVYRDLYQLLKDKDYFVITTNVDHCFQKAGFDKERLFYTQGDYGLFQSVNPAIRRTYDNRDWIMEAMEAQGYVRGEDGIFQLPKDGRVSMAIPEDLLPVCPDDGSDFTMNLRSDDSFVEDQGWHRASAAYAEFLAGHQGQHVLFLELGVGSNTPVIVKYPFWQMTLENDQAVYACVNYGQAFCPGGIEERSICLDIDIGRLLAEIKKEVEG